MDAVDPWKAIERLQPYDDLWELVYRWTSEADVSARVREHRRVGCFCSKIGIDISM